MYQPQNHYYHNLGVAGHRASNSYSQHFQNRPYYGNYHQPVYPTHNQVLPNAKTHQHNQYRQQPPVASQNLASNFSHAKQNQTVNGGINSVLQYDLNNMSSFLSWCAFGMLKQSKNPSADFESLVVSVLFATRLPNSTIIIALEYMNQRFSSNEEITSQNLTEQEIFIYLIVALVLANKFNDDNTFTNKSWCGATGLELATLNTHEKTWLEECKWSLNVVNFEANILTLEQCWKTWLEKYDRTNPVPGAETHEHAYSGLEESASSPSSAYTYPASSPIPPSYYPHVNVGQAFVPSYYQMNSIPSSPVYGRNLGGQYYHSSPSMSSSPLSSDSGAHWRKNLHRSNSSIWNHSAPTYYQSGQPLQPHFPAFANDPNLLFVNNAESLYVPFHPRPTLGNHGYPPHLGFPINPQHMALPPSPYNTSPYYGYSAAIC